VLGRTGRNFAAGMSGGIAYVLDEMGDFREKRCNLVGVDLEPVMDTSDIQLLRHWITRHFEATGSPRAEWILENFTQMLPRFLKIFPHEYKRVLGIARKKPDSEKPTQHAPGVPTIDVNKQVIHG
jgi:glutamate synthase domain-containing protein 3